MVPFIVKSKNPSNACGQQVAIKPPFRVSRSGARDRRASIPSQKTRKTRPHEHYILSVTFNSWQKCKWAICKIAPGIQFSKCERRGKALRPFLRCMRLVRRAPPPILPPPPNCQPPAHTHQAHDPPPTPDHTYHAPLPSYLPTPITITPAHVHNTHYCHTTHSPLHPPDHTTFPHHPAHGPQPLIRHVRPSSSCFIRRYATSPSPHASPITSSAWTPLEIFPTASTLG